MSTRGPTPASLAVRLAGAVAILFAPLILAACAPGDANPGDRAIFTALTGEAPGTRPAYIDLMGEHPLGRPPPPVGSRVFRPPPVPEATAQGDAAAGLKRIYERLRLRLSDRDDILQFRRRSLRVALGAYTAAIEDLRLQHGDPLPPYTEALRDRIAEARRALNAIRADLLQLSNVLSGAEADERLIAAVADRARRVRDGLPADDDDRALVETIGERLDAAAGIVEAMQATLSAELGRFIEYVEGQEQALDQFDRQVRAAADAPADEGPRAPAIFRRRSILDP